MKKLKSLQFLVNFAKNKKISNIIKNKYFGKSKNKEIIEIPYVSKEMGLFFYLKLFEKLYK